MPRSILYLDTIYLYNQIVFDKIKNLFKKKKVEPIIANITIVVDGETFSNVSPEQAEVLFKKLTEGLKNLS